MTILYIVIAILILAFIIFFHELGHYTAGKLLGFRILDFSLGFGPALIKFKKGETNYAIRAIPFGGACQFDGEDDDAEDDPRRFNAQPVWKRFLVIFAGPFMNILLAFLVAFFVLLTTPVDIYASDAATGDYIPQVMTVVEGGAAEASGVRPGDLMLAVNGQSPFAQDDETSINALVNLIGSASGEFILTVERNGETIDIPIKNAYNEETKTNVIGVSIGALVERTEARSFGASVVGSADYLINIVRATAQAFAGMFKDGIHQGDVSGALGTVALMVDVAQQSTADLFVVAIIISLSLGLFNLIPFPALDGGRLLFLVIEAIIGRPLNRKVEGMVNAIGLMLLFGLMIIVTISDVISFF